MLNPITYALIECLAWGRQQFVNPTRHWPPRGVSDLTFELASHTLCGMPIDAPLAKARLFGPADRLVGVSPEYDLLYYKLGLQLDLFEARIISFRVLVDPASRPQYWERRCLPARLQLRMLDGSLHVLSRETSEASMLGLFGSPLDTGLIGDDRVHTFSVGGNLIDSYHEPESRRLVELTIGLSAD